MKRLLVLVLALLLSLPVLAHSGRTDSDGGHYDRSTGEYHYHHGYSAHQHEGGECPYDFDDRTGESSGTSSSGSSSSSSSSEEAEEEPEEEEEEHPFWAFLKGFFKVVLYIFLGIVALFLIVGFFSLFDR